MNIENIHEPIRVLAVFSGGSAEPVHFQWHGRTYKIDAVNGRWIDRGPQTPTLRRGTSGFGVPFGDPGQGQTYSSPGRISPWADLHYSVQVGDETYNLHFSSKQVQWWLDEVVVP